MGSGKDMVFADDAAATSMGARLNRNLERVGFLCCLPPGSDSLS